MTQFANVATDSQVLHSTFRIERSYAQPPARVFHAFADKSTVRRWRVEDEGCVVHEFSFDFRVGGSERSRFSFMGGPEIRLDAQFQDIVPDRRIVFAYRMAMGPAAFSASLATVEFVPGEGGGTRLVYTEQGAYMEGGEEAAQGREEGSRSLLEKLARELQRSH